MCAIREKKALLRSLPMLQIDWNALESFPPVFMAAAIVEESPTRVFRDRGSHVARRRVKSVVVVRVEEGWLFPVCW